MKNKIIMLASAGIIVASGLIYGFSSTSNCPLEGTQECPKINCPLAGAPECPYGLEKTDLPECCKGKE